MIHLNGFDLNITGAEVDHNGFLYTGNAVYMTRNTFSPTARVTSWKDADPVAESCARMQNAHGLIIDAQIHNFSVFDSLGRHWIST